mmetsp:Transcript_8278/g.12320  ORF Transcript_8278/g.12320 Transcript_8278/m.12320 type:complete len:87 (+) Transcript_8278:19-279(+)
MFPRKERTFRIQIAEQREEVLPVCLNKTIKTEITCSLLFTYSVTVRHTGHMSNPLGIPEMPCVRRISRLCSGEARFVNEDALAPLK